MGLYHTVVDVLRMSLLLVGSVVIVMGIAQAALGALRFGSGRPAVKQNVVASVALGLEFFIGATILNLILNPTWAAVQITAMSIVVRKLITLSVARSARGG